MDIASLDAVGLSARLRELQEDGELTSQEAKRLAGFLLLEAHGVLPRTSVTYWRNSTLARRVRLYFLPSQASTQLAKCIIDLRNGGYVNEYEARRVCGWLVLSLCNANFQDYVTERRDAKLVRDLGLFRFAGLLQRSEVAA